MAPDLADLAAAAERVESGLSATAPATKPEPELAAPDYRGACRELVEAVASVALPLVAWRWGAEVADLYGPRELARIGDALGDVAQKRGWHLEDLLAGYGPELALAAALAGPALPLIVARAKAARAAQDAAAEPAATPPPVATPAPRPPVTPHDGSAPAAGH